MSATASDSSSHHSRLTLEIAVKQRLEVDGEPIFQSPSRSKVFPSPREGSSSRSSHAPPSRLGNDLLRSLWKTRNAVSLVAIGGVLLLCVNFWMYTCLQGGGTDVVAEANAVVRLASPASDAAGRWKSVKTKTKVTLSFLNGRLLALAAHALAERDKKAEPPELWQEPLNDVASWVPCADRRESKAPGRSYGYILVSANGGMNQQRIAICNAVAIARLLNAHLVIPYLQYNNVWQDRSQFGDIYQEDYFINYLKDDVRIVKELPAKLQSLDLGAIGSVFTDTEVMKEAKPSFFVKNVLPILLKNEVVHFVGFGNRLASDPIPHELQRLRCRCNFHALQFIDKIRKTGTLLVQRLHQHLLPGPLEHNLLGLPEAVNASLKKKDRVKTSKYLAVHLRFEIDMVAYSLCYFGGGKEEEDELEAFRILHFPTLTMLKNNTKVPSAAKLRSEGQCPLTPEEAVLMLAALGFRRRTRIYIAGANIYGGKSRMAVLRSLYPKIVTKEKLLSESEILPFANYSSQLAALDFIACTAADAFAMTDSGSQFSALVSGYRMYFGEGKFPTIRPNKRRLASIFSKNNTIEWWMFEKRVRKSIRQTKNVIERPTARSIYRHPRCPACMCKIR